MRKVLYCGKLLDAQKQKVLPNMVVVVEQKHITHVLPQVEFHKEPEDEIIDLNDAFVLPGLIDMHVHIHCDGDAGNADYFLIDSAATHTLKALQYVQQDLLGGFTTLRNEYSPFWLDVAIRDHINAGNAWGPRLFVCGPGITATGGHADLNLPPHVRCVEGGGEVVNCPADARRAARNMIKYGVNHLKMSATGGITSIGDDPGSQELTYEEMRAYCEIAEFVGIPVSAHTHGSKGIQAALRAGATFIEHATMADEETLQMMADAGVYYCPTLLPYRLIGELPLPPETKAKYDCCGGAEHHRAVVARAKELGIKMIFGTDRGCPDIYPGTQGREFCDLVQAGLTPMEAIMTATVTAAQALRKSEELGSVDAGKFADIVACKGDPTEDINNILDISFVMKDGIVYKENGKAKTL